MKKTIRSMAWIISVLLLLFCLISCNTVEKAGIWEDATYRKDMEFGEGDKTVVVEVEAEKQIVTFTIRTDAETVGEALLEHELIDGEQGAFGLYVKVVNGITADFDVDQSYWSFQIDGEYAMAGVDGTEIVEGSIYRLIYTK